MPSSPIAARSTDVRRARRPRPRGARRPAEQLGRRRARGGELGAQRGEQVDRVRLARDLRARDEQAQRAIERDRPGLALLDRRLAREIGLQLRHQAASTRDVRKGARRQQREVERGAAEFETDAELGRGRGGFRVAQGALRVVDGARG
jgi:hypothetical protein